MRRFTFSVVLLLGSLTLISTARNQVQPEVGSIRVVIRAKGKELANIPLLTGTVTTIPKKRDSETPDPVRADKRGYYIVASLAPGEYTVTANVSGYKSESKTVEVKKFRSRPLNFDLSPNPPARR